jgi:hypothetical protein
MGLSNIERWLGVAHNKDAAGLSEILHDDVVFSSPVVHTPQRGKALTTAYLTAALDVLANESFSYVRTFDCGSRAALEFEAEVEGTHINGVDLIEWDDSGRITDFKVMIRPLQAIQKIHAGMAEMLKKMPAQPPA